MKRGRDSPVLISIKDLPIEILSIVIHITVSYIGTQEGFYRLFCLSCVDKHWRMVVIDHVIPTFYESMDIILTSLRYTNWFIDCCAPRIKYLLLEDSSSRFIGAKTLERLTSLNHLECYGELKETFDKFVLKKLVHLRRLTLSNTDIDSIVTWASILDQFQCISIIDFSSAFFRHEYFRMDKRVSDVLRSLSRVLKNMKSLRHLFLPCGELIPTNIVKSMTNLETLGIQSRFTLTIDDLCEMPNLVHLSLGGSIPFVDLSRLTRIGSLTLDNVTCRGHDMHIVFPSSLRNLRLKHNYSVTDTDFANLTNLRSLILEMTRRITDDALKHLDLLEEIDIRGSTSSITDMGLGYLTSLRKLCVDRYSHVTDKAISKLPLLTKLYIVDPWKETYPLTLAVHPHLILKNCDYRYHLWEDSIGLEI